jgi:predicted ATPase
LVRIVPIGNCKDTDRVRLIVDLDLADQIGQRHFAVGILSVCQHDNRGDLLLIEGLVRHHLIIGQVEEINAPAVSCLMFEALSEWHIAEIAAWQATMAEAISLAKGLNDMHGLAVALLIAGILAQLERNPSEVERLALDLVELSMRQNFALWLAAGAVLRGWARSASGDTAEGISWTEDGLEDLRATGSILSVPYCLGLKAEALHLADRTSEALEVIKEAEALVGRSEERWSSAELHRLRGVFLAALGADESQIEASFREAIRTAREQKSISLKKRAEATYAEYRSQKASASRGRRFRLPLC